MKYRFLIIRRFHKRLGSKDNDAPRNEITSHQIFKKETEIFVFLFTFCFLELDTPIHSSSK